MSDQGHLAWHAASGSPWRTITNNCRVKIKTDPAVWNLGSVVCPVSNYAWYVLKQYMHGWSEETPKVKWATAHCLPPRLGYVRLCLLSAEGWSQDWTWPPSGVGLEGSGLTAVQPNQPQKCELSHPSNWGFLQTLQLHLVHLCLLSQLAAWYLPAVQCSLQHRRHIISLANKYLNGKHKSCLN